MNDNIDTTDLLNDLIDAVAELFPEVYQKSKEAIIRDEFAKILKSYLE